MTKCSHAMLNQICLLRSQGNHMKGIAEIVGINRHTLYVWIKKGEKARIGKFAKFYSDWEDATEDYYKLNPPKILTSQNMEERTFQDIQDLKRKYWQEIRFVFVVDMMITLKSIIYMEQRRTQNLLLM